MAQQYLAELEELWIQVRDARDEWFQHFDSEAVHRMHTVGPEWPEDAPENPNIAYKIHRIEPILTAFQSRLHALFKFSLLSTPTLPSLASLIATHLDRHQPIGPESLTSRLHRVLDSIDDHLHDTNEALKTYEEAIAARFTDVHGHYRTFRTMLNLVGESVEKCQDGMAFVEQTLRARRGKPWSAETAREERILRESWRACEESVRVCEMAMKKQWLRWLHNMSLVGVRVARQRLITEFFLPVEEDDYES